MRLAGLAECMAPPTLSFGCSRRIASGNSLRGNTDSPGAVATAFAGVFGSERDVVVTLPFLGAPANAAEAAGGTAAVRRGDSGVTPTGGSAAGGRRTVAGSTTAEAAGGGNGLGASGVIGARGAVAAKGAAGADTSSPMNHQAASPSANNPKPQLAQRHGSLGGASNSSSAAANGTAWV